MDAITMIRPILCTAAIAILFYLGYWESLVESLEGSIFKAGLIVLMAWVCGAFVDLNDMSGQPDDDDHEHDD